MRARQGLHASPVAYKREGANPIMRSFRTLKHGTGKAEREVCASCGSDAIARTGPSVICGACGAGYMLSRADAPTIKVRFTTEQRKRCGLCKGTIVSGQRFSVHEYYAAEGTDTVKVTYCEACASERVPLRQHGGKAYRKEAKAERRARGHARYRKSQVRSSRKAPKRRHAKRPKPEHHAAVKAARRQGWAKVDGCWRKVV